LNQGFRFGRFPDLKAFYLFQRDGSGISALTPDTDAIRDENYTVVEGEHHNLLAALRTG
jgi:hypothetical protein